MTFWDWIWLLLLSPALIACGILFLFLGWFFVAVIAGVLEWAAERIRVWLKRR